PRWSFPCWFWDYDNDGRLDLFVASYTFAGGEWVRPYLGLPRVGESMRLYRNAGKGTFVDATVDAGLDRAVAAMGANFGDAYNDVLFANPGGENDWLSIKLVGVKSNRAGIGAKIKVTLAGTGGIRYREVSSGGSFGASPLTQHVGLGKGARMASIEIVWP